jgi:hypothetical protein
MQKYEILRRVGFGLLRFARKDKHVLGQRGDCIDIGELVSWRVLIPTTQQPFRYFAFRYLAISLCLGAWDE